MTSNLNEFFSDLITASHILHYNNVVDGYGHISARHPDNASTFFMSRSMAPGLVASPSDLVEYYIENAEPVKPDAPKGFLERHIHSELMRRYPTVNSVIHSHAPDTIPFGVTDIPMRPCSSLAGFLGSQVPKFDAADYYTADDDLPRDLLIRSGQQGGKLAAFFSKDDSSKEPDHAVVLMKAHGFATVAPSVQAAVFQAMYTQTNAKILTSTITMLGAFHGKPATENSIRYLSAEEAHAIAIGHSMTTAQRPWSQWKREVEVSDLYRNSLNTNYGEAGRGDVSNS